MIKMENAKLQQHRLGYYTLFFFFLLLFHDPFHNCLPSSLSTKRQKGVIECESPPFSGCQGGLDVREDRAGAACKLLLISRKGRNCTLLRGRWRETSPKGSGKERDAFWCTAKIHFWEKSFFLCCVRDAFCRSGCTCCGGQDG